MGYVAWRHPYHFPVAPYCVAVTYCVAPPRLGTTALDQSFSPSGTWIPLHRYLGHYLNLTCIRKYIQINYLSIKRQYKKLLLGQTTFHWHFKHKWLRTLALTSYLVCCHNRDDENVSESSDENDDSENERNENRRQQFHKMTWRNNSMKKLVTIVNLAVSSSI